MIGPPIHPEAAPGGGAAGVDMLLGAVTAALAGKHMSDTVTWFL